MAKTEAADPAEANATYITIRLHEGYFDNLGGKAGASGKIRGLIKRDFGSYEAWEKEFWALGICARGWVILAYSLLDKRLHNYLCDVHNQGGVWGCIPLLIPDVYEHAYFIDYGTGRKAYIEAYTKNIDWGFVNGLLEKHNFIR